MRRSFWLAVLAGWTGVGLFVGARAEADRAQSSGEPRPFFTTQRGTHRLHVAARGATGILPKSVSVAPDGSRVFVCNFGRPDRETVTVHDPDTLARVGAIDFPGNAVESAFSRDGRTLYVSNFRRNMLEVIDVESLRVRAEVAVGANPKTVTVSPDGRWVYVANWSSNDVSVVDAQQLREVRVLRTGAHPRGMVAEPNGRLLVAAFDAQMIQEFDPLASTLMRSFPTCRMPRHLVMGPDPSRVYTTCTLSSISWYDIETGLHLGAGYAGGNPKTLGISADGRWLATANFDSSAVSLVDTVAGTSQTSPVPEADGVVGLAFDPRPGLRLYVTSWRTAEVIALVPASRGGSGAR